MEVKNLHLSYDKDLMKRVSGKSGLKIICNDAAFPWYNTRFRLFTFKSLMIIN